MAIAGLRDEQIVKLRPEARAIEHERALLEIGHAVVLEDEIVQCDSRGRRRWPDLAVRTYTQKRAHADAAERVVLDDDGTTCRHVECLAVQIFDHAILYCHGARAPHDEGVAPDDAHPHAVQHKLMVDLDIVHRPAGHLVAEATANHMQITDVEFLEGLRLRCVNAAVL